MPDSLRNVARERAAAPARYGPVGGFFLGVWLRLMWGWCHVSTWAYALYILAKKIAVGLLGIGNLPRRQRPIPEWLAVTAVKVLWAIVRRFGQLLLWVWNRIVGLVRKIWRAAGDLLAQVQRTQNQLKKRATLVLFERLKTSRWPDQVGQFFESRLKAGRASAAELAGLIDFALAIGRKERAVAYIDALIEGFPDEIDMHASSAVRCYLLGEYALAEDIWSRSAEIRERKVVERGLDTLSLRFLGPSWFVAIGHIAHLDTYLKHQALSGTVARHYYPIIPSHFAIPNRYFLDLWKPLLSQVEFPLVKMLDPDEIELLQDEFWSLRLAPGNTLIYHKAGAAVQKAWHESGRAPLLALPQADIQKGWEALETLGVPRNAWFVCLHVREPGFHQKWHQSHPGTRNADVATYRAAIEAIVQRGGYVIRVGDSTMVPLPPMAGAIDYAHSDEKSDFMDVFLCATCSFFIGTNSGLGLVPPAFGVPCVLTNWSPIAIPQWYPQDLFVPKLVRSERDNRLLSFEELYATPAGWKQFEEYFSDHGLRVIDNTPDELRDVVVEMFERRAGAATYTADDERRRAEFERLAAHYTDYVGSRIGRDFLKKHGGLLGPALARRPSVLTPVTSAAHERAG